MDMASNHEDRVVDNFKKDKIIVDTCMVTDSDQPFETGVSHPAWNNSAWVIVEMYLTKTEAQAGHNKWVKIITADVLPKKLVDVSTSTIKKYMILFN